MGCTHLPASGFFIMDQSWFKIYRKIIDWEWFSCPYTLKVFIYLLSVANYKKKNWRGLELQPGDVITGRKQLALNLDMSEQKIRTILERLKSTNEITIKTSPQGSVIHIVRYAMYQISTNESTNEQPTNNQPTTNEQPLLKKDRKKEGNKDISNNGYTTTHFFNDLLTLGIDEQLANDVIEHRKKSKGIFTQRSFNGLKGELDKFALGEKKSSADALTFLVEQTSWRTFTYEFYKNRIKHFTNSQNQNNGKKHQYQIHVAEKIDFGNGYGTLQS